MCHPGFVDAELQRLDPLTTLREQEYAYFAGDDFSGGARRPRRGVGVRPDRTTIFLHFPGIERQVFMRGHSTAMGAGLHDSRRHGRKGEANDPRGTQLVTDLFDACHAGGRPARPRGRTRDHGWPAPGPQCGYALVQTALVQDEALKRADARIRELEDATQQPVQREASFLGSMREAV